MEYKTDDGLDLTSILHPSIEKPIEITPALEDVSERDMELLNHLADVFNALPDISDVSFSLSDILKCINNITYNIDDLLSQTDALCALASIIKLDEDILNKQKCLEIVLKLSQYSDIILPFFFENSKCLVENLKFPETLYPILEIFSKIIDRDREYTSSLIMNADLLSQCCFLLNKIHEEEPKLIVLLMIEKILQNTDINTFHSIYKDQEVIKIPLEAIKQTICIDFQLVTCFRIINIIADNWTGDFRSLFDDNFSHKCLKIWSSGFPDDEENNIVLCKEIIKLLNQFIFLFQNDFIIFGFYKPVIKTLSELAKRENFPHSKILYLCSNIASHPVSGGELLSSGIFDFYEQKYQTMPAHLKENFLLTFGNLILSKVIPFDDNSATIDYINEMLDQGASNSSSELKSLTLNLLNKFRDEVVEYLDANDVREFIEEISENGDSEQAEKANELRSNLFSNDESELILDV